MSCRPRTHPLPLPQYSLCNEPLIELSNPGASGSLFYVTSDDEFIIKTVMHKEAEFLQKLLPGYYMVRARLRGPGRGAPGAHTAPPAGGLPGRLPGLPSGGPPGSSCCRLGLVAVPWRVERGHRPCLAPQPHPSMPLSHPSQKPWLMGRVSQQP